MRQFILIDWLTPLDLIKGETGGEKEVIMYHQFNVEIATLVGLEEAIIFNNLCYCYSIVKDNPKNVVNGKVWIRIKQNKLKEIFPYLGTQQNISLHIKRLIDLGFIEAQIVQILNDNAFDRTLSYSITEKAIDTFKLDFNVIIEHKKSLEKRGYKPIAPVSKWYEEERKLKKSNKATADASNEKLITLEELFKVN